MKEREDTVCKNADQVTMCNGAGRTFLLCLDCLRINCAVIDI